MSIKMCHARPQHGELESGLKILVASGPAAASLGLPWDCGTTKLHHYFFILLFAACRRSSPSTAHHPSGSVTPVPHWAVSPSPASLTMPLGQVTRRRDIESTGILGEPLLRTSSSNLKLGSTTCSSCGNDVPMSLEDITERPSSRRDTRERGAPKFSPSQSPTAALLPSTRVHLPHFLLPSPSQCV